MPSHHQGYFIIQAKPIIRFVKPSDLEELITLCKEHAEYEKSDFKVAGKIEALSKHLFAPNPSLYCLVIEVNSQLIGYATFMKQFSTWESEFYIYMDCLFLNGVSRGLGLGEQVINRIKTESVKLGCELIQWQTPDFNTGAIRFYNRVGAISKTKERFFLSPSS